MASSITDFQNKNTELNKSIKNQNDLINKYKNKLNVLEKEKKELSDKINQREEKILKNNNKINNLKEEIEQIKQTLLNISDNLEDNELTEEKNELEKGKKLNEEVIKELQNKIIELENELKTENDNNEKNESDNFNISDYLSNNYNNDNDFFITGNLLVELKDKNEKLLKTIEENKLNLEKLKNELKELKKELEKEIDGQNSILLTLQNKQGVLQKILNEENILSNKKYENELGNKQLNLKINNLNIKIKTLEIDKKDLEEIILKQEGKVNELNRNVEKIISLLTKKNYEIEENKVYINQLNEIINELNYEFNILKNKQEQNDMKLNNLKNELNKLQKKKNKSYIKSYIKSYGDYNINYKKKINVNPFSRNKFIPNKKLQLRKIVSIKDSNISNTERKNNNYKYRKIFEYKNEDTDRILNESENLIEKTIQYTKNRDYQVAHLKSKSYAHNNINELNDKKDINKIKSMINELIGEFN